MDNKELIYFIIAIIACFVGMAGWLSRRDGKNIKDAEWKGTINAKLDLILGINSRIDKVECKVDNHTIQIAKLESRAEGNYHRLDDADKNII